MSRTLSARLLLVASPFAAWSTVSAQTATAPATPAVTVDLKAVLDSVAPTGTTLERTRTLVRWINDQFTWSYTDYVQRTPQQIVAQRRGNCAELASVLRAFLDASSIRTRWVSEINVQPGETPHRLKTADSMVTVRGNRMSVFGLQHNDHAWLEVWDERAQAWFPADPAYGVVGVDEWLPARLAMANRPKPRVAAVERIAADMLVPFVVLAWERRGQTVAEDRTSFYLIDGFDRLYGGNLHTLKTWPEWVRAVNELSPTARGAFEGTANLHKEGAKVGALKRTYDQLTKEAAAKRLAFIKSD